MMIPFTERRQKTPLQTLAEILCDCDTEKYRQSIKASENQLQEAVEIIELMMEPTQEDCERQMIHDIAKAFIKRVKRI